jgi:membrane protease YdiL (CAAX protease family)
MLLVAAAVAGGIWGLLYRLYPQRLGALIISHAVWDAAVFVIFPI